MQCTEIVCEVRESKSLHVLDRISEVNIPIASNIFRYVSHSSWGSRGKGFQYRSTQNISNFESLRLPDFFQNCYFINMERNFKNNSWSWLPCMAMYEMKINTAQPIPTVKGLEMSRGRLCFWFPNNLVKKTCLQKNITYHVQIIFRFYR